MRLQSKLTILLVLLAVVVLAGLSFFINYEVEHYFKTRIVADLESQTRELEFILRSFAGASSAQEFPYEKIQELARIANLRLTLISADGSVIFESQISADQLDKLDNQLSRPEVRDASRKGMGVSERGSESTNQETMYVALRLFEPLRLPGSTSEAAILRIGLSLADINSAIGALRWKLLLAGLVVLLPVAVVAFLLSRLISRPINAMAKVATAVKAGDFEQRIRVLARDEIGKLADAINSMIDKLNEDIVQLKKLERVRSEFLGNVSHELRTPIFALQASLETLLGGAMDDPSANREFLNKALANARRLDALLSDLIEISRIESGEMKMSFRYFTLRDFLTQVVAEMLPHAEKKGILLSYEPRSSEVLVFGDKERLKQALWNLITNAIKYTDPGGSVTLVYEIHSNRVRVSVSDTGCGIPSEHIPYIFQRFYRVDKDRSREVGGTGLGLSIVKHIIEAHGSKVEVHSEVGKGTTFSFALKT